MAYTAERPAMDISNAADQEAIANSLIAPQEEVFDGRTDWEPEEPASDFSDSASHFSDLSADADRIADSLIGKEQQADGELESDSQPESESPKPVSLEQAVEQMDAHIEAIGLDDPAPTHRLAGELGLELTDAKGFDSVMSRALLSADMALQSGVTGPVDQQAAEMFAAQFLPALGHDGPVDSQGLANTIFEAAKNVLATLARTGIDAPTQQINSPENVQMYAQRFYEAIGGQGRVNPVTAQKLANAFAGFVQAKVRTAQSSQSRPNSRGGKRSSPNSKPKSRFETNADIFDAEAEEIYRREHGKL